MSVLDTNLIAEIQSHLVETSDWGTGQWTQQECVDALNQAQDRFLRDTAAVLTVARLDTTPNTPTQNLPQDWQQTQRAAWIDAATSTSTALGQADAWEADNLDPSWPYDQSGHPVLYSDITTAPAEYQLIPAPQVVGQTRLLYTPQGTPLTGIGTALTAPDDVTPAVKWLALATLLRKLNRSLDAERASYCEQRYEDYVEMTQFALEGF